MWREEKSLNIGLDGLRLASPGCGKCLVAKEESGKWRMCSLSGYVWQVAERAGREGLRLRELEQVTEGDAMERRNTARQNWIRVSSESVLDCSWWKIEILCNLPLRNSLFELTQVSSLFYTFPKRSLEYSSTILVFSLFLCPPTVHTKSVIRSWEILLYMWTKWLQKQHSCMTAEKLPQAMSLESVSVGTASALNMKNIRGCGEVILTPL